KHRTDSGLIRYDQRRDLEWPQVAREIIAAEKPKFIVMMIGNNDRQTIREKAPPAVARPAAPNPNTQAAQPSPPAATPPIPTPPPTHPPAPPPPRSRPHRPPRSNSPPPPPRPPNTPT